jgi:hypothetical protein
MDNTYGPIFWIVVASFILGILVLIGMALLYLRSYQGIDGDIKIDFGDMYKISGGSIPDPKTYPYYWNTAVTLRSEAISDAMAKREIFWTLLVQSAVSLVVVVFIAILLLLKIVSAEAGLPVLATLGGAAISQGVSSGRAASRARVGLPPASASAPPG